MINSEAIQEQVANVFDDILPSSPNALLVTRSGGAQNGYGEKVGQSEALAPVYIYSTGEVEKTRATGAGNTEPIAIGFVAKATVEIRQGDRLRWDGHDYNVGMIEKVTIGDHLVYVDGQMTKIHGN